MDQPWSSPWISPPLGSGFSGIVFDGLDMDDSCLPKQLLWAERADG